MYISAVIIGKVSGINLTSGAIYGIEFDLICRLRGMLSSEDTRGNLVGASITVSPHCVSRE